VQRAHKVCASGVRRLDVAHARGEQREASHRLVAQPLAEAGEGGHGGVQRLVRHKRAQHRVAGGSLCGVGERRERRGAGPAEGHLGEREHVLRIAKATEREGRAAVEVRLVQRGHPTEQV